MNIVPKLAEQAPAIKPEVAEQAPAIKPKEPRPESFELLQPHEWFQWYISPIEALNIHEDEANAKTILKAKKMLLREIEMEDGKVSWLDNCVIDTAIAHKIDDELLDPTKAHYHRVIFKDKDLLQFLTRGNVVHLLQGYANQSFTVDPKFLQFLSKKYAQQYNAVLTCALELQENPKLRQSDPLLLKAIILALPKARQFIEPKDVELCFSGAMSMLNLLLNRMRDSFADFNTRKVELKQIDYYLNKHRLIEILKLLPAEFATVREDLVGILRTMALAANNVHNDPPLSKDILSICERIQIRDGKLLEQLKDDNTIIDRIIETERNHKFSWEVSSGVSVKITKLGIKYDGVKILTEDIEALRWGIASTYNQGIESERKCLLVVKSADAQVTIRLNKRGVLSQIRGFFRNAQTTIPMADLPDDIQAKVFLQMIDSVICFFMPTLLSKLVNRLKKDQSISIGSCRLNYRYIVVDGHRLFWEDSTAVLSNGQLHISHRNDRNIHTTMTLGDTDNAILVPAIRAKILGIDI